MIEAHPIPFRGMVLLRKCLESHHSSKLSDELPVKGSEELRLTRPEGLVETWGEVDLTVAKGDRSPPQVLRGRRSCLRRTKGLLRHAFSECEIWAYKVPEGSRQARRTDHLIEAHPIPFRGMVLLRKCLESHHSSKT